MTEGSSVSCSSHYCQSLKPSWVWTNLTLHLLPGEPIPQTHGADGPITYWQCSQEGTARSGKPAPLSIHNQVSTGRARAVPVKAWLEWEMAGQWNQPRVNSLGFWSCNAQCFIQQVNIWTRIPLLKYIYKLLFTVLHTYLITFTVKHFELHFYTVLYMYIFKLPQIMAQ